MNRRLFWLLTGLLALLYLAFVTLDLTGTGRALPPVFRSSSLKYAGMAVCLLLALCALPRAPHRRGCARLVLALCLTLAADYFLLFTRHFEVGVGLFCLAHLAHLWRYRSSVLLPAALCTAAVFAACAVAALAGRRWLCLPLLCVLYAALILTATVTAFHLPPPWPGRRLRLGMVLFLLCDVNVLLFNTLPPGWPHTAASVLMWVFYLPAQYLLATSCLAPFPPARAGAGSSGPPS